MPHQITLGLDLRLGHLKLLSEYAQGPRVDRHMDVPSIPALPLGKKSLNVIGSCVDNPAGHVDVYIHVFKN